ncbi:MULTISPECIES: acyltransferase [Amylolactobacillus]|uniref:acyltransferase n=1 Tax=Amylolactobacillus TaxID=2767876 RepID=UPI003AAD18D7
MDFLRIFSAILVVMTHSLAPFAVQNIFYARLLNRFASVAVPIFFILSGYSVIYTVKRHPNISFLDIVKHDLKRLFLPYITWSLLYFAYLVLSHSARDYNIRYLITHILYGNMWYHTYFLLIMIIQYPISIMFYKLMQKYSKLIFMVLLISPIIVSLVTGIIPINFINRILWLSPLQWGIYFYIGIWLHEHNYLEHLSTPIVLTSYIILAITLTVALFIERLQTNQFVIYLEYYDPLLMTLATLIIFYKLGTWIIKILPQLHSPVKFLSSLTYTLYLSHPVILIIFNRIHFEPFNARGTFTLFVYFPIVLISAVVLATILNKSESVLLNFQTKYATAKKH